LVTLILALLLGGWLWSEPAQAADGIGVPSLDVEVDVQTPVGDVSASISTTSGDNMQTAPIDLALTPAAQTNLETPAGSLGLDASSATLTGDQTSTKLTTPAARATVSTPSASTRVGVSPAKVETRYAKASGLEVTLASPAVRADVSTPLATAQVEVESATAHVSGAPSIAASESATPTPVRGSSPDRSSAGSGGMGSVAARDPERVAGSLGSHGRSLVELPRFGIAGSLAPGIGPVPGRDAARPAAVGWSRSSAIRPDATPGFSAQAAASREVPPRSAPLIPSRLDRLGIAAGACLAPSGPTIAAVLTLFALGVAGFAALLAVEQPRLRPSRLASPLERPG
jgi:hypothetical protein